MKKILLILLLLITPITVKAESHYLYDVLKDAAEEGIYAEEYIGEHQDSMDSTLSTEKIYHWKADDENESNIIKDKWNVIFGGFCWQTIRTTDTGGVKLVYNGLPNEGQCNNVGLDASIGKVSFNQELFISEVGYMYNNKYKFNKKELDQESVLESATLSSSYWYADSITWNSTNNKWTLSNPYKVTTTNNNQNLVGKYTFHTNNQDYSSEVVRYITAVNNNNYYYIDLKNGNDISYYNDTYTYGNSYTDNGDGTYTINNPTTIQRTDYYSNYNNMVYRYICKNAVNNTCRQLWYSPIITNHRIEYIKSNDNYKYANGFTYDENTGLYTLNDDSVTFWQRKSNGTQLKTHHYTCWNESGKCSTLSYITNRNGEKLIYVDLKNGKSVENALEESLSADNVNQEDSIMKICIDLWYRQNMTSYTSYIEDTIYCNKRIIKELNGWNPNGGDLEQSLSFQEYLNESSDLSCPNETDRFSINNSKARLTYPVGLLTKSETNLLGNNNLRKTNQSYWLISPAVLDIETVNTAVYTDGDYVSSNTISDFTARPVVSLKPGTKYKSGEGSKNNPYVIDTRENYKVNVEINNETEDLTVEIDDLSQVPKGEIVSFKVTPIKGRKLTSLRIVDENNNEVEYTTTDNKNYTFTMPATDVTIKPSYERVKNAVNVEDNKNTKEFIIEVNDSKAVVYEDTVRFKVEPEDGYEVEKIDITDKDNNKINYKKTSNKNEYEFIMPDTDVLIKPYYRLIPTNNSNLTNPNTKRQILLIVISVIILSIMTLLYVKKKKRLN